LPRPDDKRQILLASLSIESHFRLTRPFDGTLYQGQPTICRPKKQLLADRYLLLAVYYELR